MKPKFILLLMALAMGGIVSTATAGPDLQTLELRRQIAESHRAAMVAPTSGDVVHYVASPSGKGGVVARKEGATTNIALFKSKSPKAKKDCGDASCCAKPNCNDAACCAKAK